MCAKFLGENLLRVYAGQLGRVSRARNAAAVSDRSHEDEEARHRELGLGRSGFQIFSHLKE